MKDQVSIQNQAAIWWKSEGFWASVIVLVSGFFVGFPIGDVQGAFGALVALIGAVWALRGKFKDVTPVTWKEWFAKPNTWAALVTVLVAIVPSIPVPLLDSIGQILRDIIGQNWQGVTMGVFALLNIILNLWKK